MRAFETVTDGLRFPEGPIAMPDGSVVLVEIAGQALTRVLPDGTRHIIAETGGGPNGAAIGPDGLCYVCNNGGFNWADHGGLQIPSGQADDYVTGSIQRVDLATGAIETLYEAGENAPLRGPNDIVFDTEGGFWFTDHGKTRPRERDRTGVFYARTDGSLCKEVIFPMENPNGIGLSPDGKTLFVAETFTCKLWAFDITGPGEIAMTPGLRGLGGRFLHSSPGMRYYDSLAVEAEGNVCVATIGECGISVIAPDGDLVDFVPTDDPFTTNICFGGEDMHDAWITLSGTGRLVKTRWQRPGLRLNY